MMRRLLLSILLCAGCESTPAIPPPADAPTGREPDAPTPTTPSTPSSGKPMLPASEVPPYAVSRGKSVLWKRYAVLERDLMRGLGLTQDELCKELGDRDCIRHVHLIALGGNDPFGAGIHRPPPWTLSTTPAVIDRVLLSACSAAAAKRAPVFAELDLDGPVPGTLRGTTTALFRALLARDPKPSELDQLEALREPGDDAPQNARELAVLACFVVGSSLEFLFR